MWVVVSLRLMLGQCEWLLGFTKSCLCVNQNIAFPSPVIRVHCGTGGSYMKHKEKQIVTVAIVKFWFGSTGNVYSSDTELRLSI